jgi:hypothetical protein
MLLVEVEGQVENLRVLYYLAMQEIKAVRACVVFGYQHSAALLIQTNQAVLLSNQKSCCGSNTCQSRVKVKTESRSINEFGQVPLG